jgi:hypothetical protein
VQNTNPIVLNAQGGANIWVNTSLAYKFVLKDASGVNIWTVDQIGSPSGGAILANPTSSQTITQPAPTNFSINTSGGGKFLYNGLEVATTPSANGVYSSNLTVGNSTTIPSVTDPVLGSVPTRIVSKAASSDSSSNGIASLDSTGRPVAQFDGAGRLNLDGYQPGGPVIDLRNWTTLSSGDLIGHYAFGMKTDAGQAITSGGVFHIMNTSTQANVNTQLALKFAKGLNASACVGFCQPNGLVTVGPTSVALYDGLSLDFINQATLQEINGQINHVFQLRPRGAGDGFTFPNNSNNWLHVDAGMNLRWINDGSKASMQSVNDAGNSFQAMDIQASALSYNNAEICTRAGDNLCGLQRVFISACSASALNTCTTNITLTHAWPDTSYMATCSPYNNLAGIPVITSIANVDGGHFNVVIYNAHATIATNSNLSCLVARLP